MNLPTPHALKKALPAPSIDSFRKAVSDILWQRDSRWLIIVGPCSIHEKEATLEYGQKLAELSREVKDSALIIMRTYFEKPRTQGGWKGFITDPDLDGSCRIGLQESRELCLNLMELGLPLATEFLDPNLALYLSDCITWGCIGARTTASQPHRQLASRLNMPMGFKNSTHGRLEPALFSIQEAARPQTFFGLDEHLSPQRIESSGNENAHLVLRGSDEAPNYSATDLRKAVHMMKEVGIETTFLVDCAHGNSQKNPLVQAKVVRSILNSLTSHELPIAGFMLESYLHTGNQPLTPSRRPGLSITDPCLGWEASRSLILEIAGSRQLSIQSSS